MTIATLSALTLAATNYTVALERFSVYGISELANLKDAELSLCRAAVDHTHATDDRVTSATIRDLILRAIDGERFLTEE